MKKILTALLALLALVMALSLSACGGGSGDLTVEKGKLHMSTNAEFPPYEMVKGDGGFEGIDVEVAGLIAEKLGLELVVDDMGFPAALEAVQNGRSDIAMAGITVNEDRLANMEFTDSYATGVQVVIIKADSPAVQSIDDLASAALIGTQEGTTGYIYCSYPPEEGGYGEDHVVAYETGAVAVQALLAGLRGHRQSARSGVCQGQPRPGDPGHRVCCGGLRHRCEEGQHPAPGAGEQGPGRAHRRRFRPEGGRQVHHRRLIHP